MRRFKAIAWTTFQELLRERIVLGIAGVALFLVLISLVLGELGFDERERMIADFSLFGAEAAVIALALVFGSTSLVREMERQTCLLVLARPVTRFQFIAAKAAGLAGILALVVLCLVVTTALLLSQWHASLILSAATIFLKAGVILTWTLFASNLVRPVLAFLAGFALYLLGHWLGDLQFFAKESQSPELIWMADALRWIVPSFDLYNWKSYFNLVNVPSARDIAGMLTQTFAWIGLGIGFSGQAFSRRDIV